MSKAKVNKRLLPLAAMEQLMKRAGADRVSDEAKLALKELLEDVADGVSKQAIEFCKHAGRKTIKADDIKLAKR